MWLTVAYHVQYAYLVKLKFDYFAGEYIRQSYIKIYYIENIQRYDDAFYCNIIIIILRILSCKIQSCKIIIMLISFIEYLIRSSPTCVFRLKFLKIIEKEN